jgi:hypothetical protein
MSAKATPFANTPRFYSHLGWFHAAWTAMDLVVDLAICKLLKITPEQTHALVAGLEFGRKTALLRSLLSQSDYKNVAQLKGFITRISKESLRNVFSHSFIASDADSVAFIHRSSQGQYSAKGYQFTPDNFVAHTKAFVQLAEDLRKALGFSAKEIGDFAAAAIPKEEKS